MSGSGLAVSEAGARKLLGSLPCYDVGELRCSPAFDWHVSALIERGIIKAYGMLPMSVWMPKQGPIFGHEAESPGASSARTQGCARSYRSDIWQKSGADIVPKKSRSIQEQLHQLRAATIEARVYDYRAALRFGPDAESHRIFCVVVVSPSAAEEEVGGSGGENEKQIAQLVLSSTTDCCRACIAEPECGKFLHTPHLHLCVSQALFTQKQIDSGLFLTSSYISSCFTTSLEINLSRLQGLHAQQVVMEPEGRGSKEALLSDAQVVAKGWRTVTGTVAQGTSARPLLVKGTL